MSCVAISHIYKAACSLAQAKGLPSLICHEPALEVRFVRGAAGHDEFGACPWHRKLRGAVKASSSVPASNPASGKIAGISMAE